MKDLEQLVRWANTNGYALRFEFTPQPEWVGCWCILVTPGPSGEKSEYYECNWIGAGIASVIDDYDLPLKGFSKRLVEEVHARRELLDAMNADDDGVAADAAAR